mmetsp:Transcript_1742/g.3156  ORF Transcript_1742/g.3156 Transcript_1742/m.3156 type:complete len:402 (+) Transcript_1742:38-1243(+)
MLQVNTKCKMTFYSSNTVHSSNQYYNPPISHGSPRRHHHLLQQQQQQEEEQQQQQQHACGQEEQGVPSSSSGTSTDLLNAALQQKLRKRDIILQKIQSIRSKRRILHTENQSLEKLKLLWMHRYNAAVKERSRALSSYLMQQTRLHEHRDAHEKLKQIYALQDIFYIWYRGPFVTINGLRLGMADCSSSLMISSATTSSSSSSSSSNLISSALEQQTNSFWNNNNVTGSPVVENSVPWHEINASLGMMALLMHTLQKYLRIYHPRYMVHPRGSTSKVLSRKTKQEWDLCHQPTAFQFFARRNWNAALNIMGYILFEIINELERFIQNNDNKEGVEAGGEDCAIPFAVMLEGDWGNERIGTVKIHGLDIAFNGDAIEWTKAMRYMAINLKMIVALVGKYITK